MEREWSTRLDLSPAMAVGRGALASDSMFVSGVPATAVFQRGSYYAVTCLSTFLPSKIDFDLTKSRILVYSDMQHSGGKDPP